VTRERVLIVSDISLDGAGRLPQRSPPEQMMGREGLLVNGHVRPVLSASPEERERWRIINACPARYLRLQIPGPQLRLLARDGRRLAVPQDMAEVLLAPGNRADPLLTLGDGSLVLLAAPYDRGSMGARMGRGPGMGTRAMAFTINGKQFDAGRTDEIAGAGTVEVWTLTNSSPMDHPMHLHIWQM
jgi:FtsP/CotA-like multicopper oxidase with cupredoxin domain